jgi:hypothetical protein
MPHCCPDQTPANRTPPSSSSHLDSQSLAKRSRLPDDRLQRAPTTRHRNRPDHRGRHQLSLDLRPQLRTRGPKRTRIRPDLPADRRSNSTDRRPLDLSPRRTRRRSNRDRIHRPQILFPPSRPAQGNLARHHHRRVDLHRRSHQRPRRSQLHTVAIADSCAELASLKIRLLPLLLLNYLDTRRWHGYFHHDDYVRFKPRLGHLGNKQFGASNGEIRPAGIWSPLNPPVNPPGALAADIAAEQILEASAPCDVVY